MILSQNFPQKIFLEIFNRKPSSGAMSIYKGVGQRGGNGGRATRLEGNPVLTVKLFSNAF